ncbi:hypothetical protein BC941DRAFT_382969 [Chlamydoabsidia padenii]|nr:hypothetical protein BC941DRAFT_382969 [Chlamydoabsidia padenii]
MNRTSNFNKTPKAKSTTQLKYNNSPVEITTYTLESQPSKTHNQANFTSINYQDSLPNGYSTSYKSETTSLTGKERVSSDSFHLKESNFGHSKTNHRGYDDSTKTKYQGTYSKSYGEDPTKSPLHGSQAFSKSYLHGKRGDSTGFKSTSGATQQHDNHKGKLFTQPFVPRAQHQHGHHRHYAPSGGQQQSQQQHHTSPDTKYIPNSPILSVAHSPGSIQHSYGIQYTAQQGHYYPHTSSPASPRSNHIQLSPSLPVPSAPIPIPHSWSTSGIQQYYAVPSSMYDPQQMQYHHHYYASYQPPQQHSSVYSYLPSLTPPSQHYQASPVSPLNQQKSPSQSYVTHHTSPSRSSKAIPIINPNTMAPVQTEITLSSSHGSKDNKLQHSTGDEKSSVPSRQIQFVDPAIKEQEEREQQERLEEEEQQRLELQQKQKIEEQQQLDNQQIQVDESASSIKLHDGDCIKSSDTITLDQPSAPMVKIDSTADLQKEVEATVITCHPSSTPASTTDDSSQAPETLDQPTPSSPGSADNTTSNQEVHLLPLTNQTSDHDVGVIQYDPAFLMQFMPLCLDTAEDLSSFQNIVDNGVSSKLGRCDNKRQNTYNGAHDKTTLRSGNSNNNNNSSYSWSTPGGATSQHHAREGRTEMGKFIGGRTLTGRGNTCNNSTVNYGIDSKPQHEEPSGGRTQGGYAGGLSTSLGRINMNSGNSITNRHRYSPHEHHGAATIPYDQVAPLEKSSNRWVPSIVSGSDIVANGDNTLLSQEEITRKVKGLLNKLTLERFDSISDKIIGYAKQSIQEDDGQSLRTVIQLIFEKACDEAAFASMWAQLCRKLYEWIPNDIKDVNTKDKSGDIMCGIPLYCRYLFSRCQYEFEKGWKSLGADDVDDSTKHGAAPGDVMLTEEYYAAVKIKRRGLGLVQFIGELYRRNMLSPKIMYQCLKRLCDNGSDAHEEEVESLCKLLTTIGADIDRNPQTATWIDFFFKRMKNEMYSSANLSSRVKFMILDVFDLRKSNWVPRNGTQDGPKTIAQIHEEAEKAKLQEKEAIAKRSATSRGQPLINQYGMNRQGTYRNTGKSMKRGGPSTSNGHSPGWNNNTSSSSSPPRHEITDYSNFGRTERSRSRNNVLGPSNNPFPSLNRSGGSTQKTQQSKSAFDFKDTSSDNTNGRTSNMFSALGHDNNDDTEPERKKLTLLPRGSALPTNDQKHTVPNTLDDVQLKRRLKNLMAEYYELADIEELILSIKELDQPGIQASLGTELIGAVELKEKQVIAVGELIPKLYKAQILDRETMVKTFQDFMDGYEDLTIDVPQAPAYVARLLIQSGIGLSQACGNISGGQEIPLSLQQAHATLTQSI